MWALKVDNSRKHYRLATGDEAAHRLLLLNEIFGPGTRDLLKGAALLGRSLPSTAAASNWRERKRMLSLPH